MITTTPEQILESLREVTDPEIGISIVDLGFIKDVLILEDEIRIKMVLTVPGCPLANYMLFTVREKAEAMAEGKKVTVELLNEPWTPPWSDPNEIG